MIGTKVTDNAQAKVTDDAQAKVTDKTVVAKTRKANKKGGLNYKKGIAFSLEMLMVIGVVAVILYLVVMNINDGQKKMNVASASSQLTSMVTDTQKLFKKSGDFTGITPAVLVNNHVVPEDMVVGGAIVDQWNGTVDIAPTTNAASNDSFITTFPKVDTSVCSNLVGAAQGAFYRISVGGTDVKNLSSSTPLSISPVTLGTQCNASGSPTVKIMFYAGRN